jgi:hypothetical protein
VKSAAYTTMVRPTMEYASSVWDPTNRKKIGNLEKVQKRAARFVFNNYKDRTPGCVTKMVESLKCEKLEERRKANRLLAPVPDGLGEERISEGLTARSFLIKAIFASSPAVVGLDILVAVYIN